jgi:hypothetical protein
MWKKAFIRLTFVLMLASMALLVVSATKTNNIAPAEKCPNGQECCKKSNNQGDNVMFWESVSTILGAVQY